MSPGRFILTFYQILQTEIKIVLTRILIKCVCVCAAVPGQTSLFGNTQGKLGTTLGTMGAFGASAFNTGATSMGFGAPQQAVGEWFRSK